MFFSKKPEYDFLLVCLGNPGKQYVTTRHNAGFLFAEWLCETQKLKIKKFKFQAYYSDIKLNGKKGLIILPQTFMNASGEAVSGFANAYDIKPKNIIVCVDDINFDVGALRIRKKGSSGGHNGLKSIIEKLGSEDFARIRIGVGAKAEEQDLVDHVLSNFTMSELKTLDTVYEKVYDAASLLADGKADEAMQRYNCTSKQ